MKFIANNINLITSSNVPEILKEYLMAYDEVYYSKANFGAILSQVIQGNDFAIWQHNFFIEKPVLLHSNFSQSIYTLKYMIKGNFTCELIGFGKSKLKENGYNLYYIPQHGMRNIWFEKGLYCCIHVNLHPCYIVELADEFYSLNDHLKKSLKATNHGFQMTPHNMDYNIKLLLKDIAKRKEQGLAKSLFIQAKIRDLLLIYIRDLIREEKDLFKVDERLLEEIKSYMLDNLQNPITIAFLAKRFGTNKATLSKGFKKQFGIPIHQFLIDERMKRATELLLENIPIQDIAILVGYVDKCSFGKAFSIYFGKSPSAYKKDPR
jgi:AraC-like DNA-binding protein